MKVELVERMRELEEKFKPTGDLDEKARQGLVNGTIPLEWMKELESAAYVLCDARGQFCLTPSGRKRLKELFPSEFDTAEDRWALEVVAEAAKKAELYKKHQDMVAEIRERSR